MPLPQRHVHKVTRLLGSDGCLIPTWKHEAADPELQQRPLFFWKVRDPYPFFCQWYLADFVDPDSDDDPERVFNCGEQYMMYHKAKTFDDQWTMAEVMATKDPLAQKALGRQVKGFSHGIWDTVKYDVVLRGNKLKFTQCIAQPQDTFVYPPRGKLESSTPDITLKELLLATGTRELAEASGSDRVWGIGYKEKFAVQARPLWGQNLLGRVLMEVRDELKQAETESAAL